jgi:PAS domain S-box-containing protein
VNININKYHYRAVILVAVIVFVLLNPAVVTAKRAIKVGVPESLPPFSFINAKDGGLRGFSVDLALLLAGNMGAKINLFSMDDLLLKKALNDGRIDVISCVAAGDGGKEDFNLLETGITVERKFFVNKSCLTVTCDKDLPGHKVTLVKGIDYTNLFTHSDDITFIEASSRQEALEMVDSGKAQVYISTCSLSTLYLIQKNGFKSIKEVGVPIESVPLALAVRSKDAELLTELSVAFGKILENKSYDLLYRKWLGHGVRFSAWEKYIKVIFLVLVLIASGLLILIFWNRLLKRRVQKVTNDLQRSEQKYRDLIESSPEMIHLVSSDCKVKLANKNALERLGYSEGEMLSVDLSRLVAPQNRAAICFFMKSVFKKGFGNKEFVFKAKNGTCIDVEMIATTVNGLDKAEDLACCFSRDITQRKRLEEELIQSERLAIMGQTAAGIAHEINNPLGIILANTEDLINTARVTEDVRVTLDSIERNAIRAGEIIEDLLSFTRPNPPEKVPIDLVELIDASLVFLKQKLRQKRINVEKCFTEEKIVFQGDENKIQQLLINLILNSIKAVPEEGSIKIRVMLDRDSETKWIRLEIEDTGVGIPADDLPKIFDPFFTARKTKGFGLGLFICKRIVEKHGGTIRVQSSTGSGTLMTVELPVQSDQEKDFSLSSAFQRQEIQ